MRSLFALDDVHYLKLDGYLCWTFCKMTNNTFQFTKELCSWKYTQVKFSYNVLSVYIVLCQKKKYEFSYTTSTKWCTSFHIHRHNIQRGNSPTMFYLFTLSSLCFIEKCIFLNNLHNKWCISFHIHIKYSGEIILRLRGLVLSKDEISPGVSYVAGYVRTMRPVLPHEHYTGDQEQRRDDSYPAI